MADIELRIGGDSTEARNAIEGVNDAWSKYGGTVTKVAQVALKFAADAVREYQAAERVSRQLERAAGDYSKALEAQAEALAAVLGVDDDLIKRQQTLLAQWGGAGAATEEVTRAVLDYAAATGKDAVGATQELIQQVETGGQGFRKLGLEFETTGDKGKDLTAIVGALSAKFGGAAASNEDALNVQLAASSQAWGDFMEASGAAIAQIAKDTNVVDTMTRALQGLNIFLFGEKDKERREKLESLMRQQVSAANLLAMHRRALEEAMADPSVSISVLERFSDDVTEAQKKLNELRRQVGELMGGPMPSAAPAVTGRTAAGKASDEKTRQQQQANAKERQEDAFHQSLLQFKRDEARRREMKEEEWAEIQQADAQQAAYAKELQQQAESAAKSEEENRRHLSQMLSDVVAYNDKLDADAAKAQQEASDAALKRMQDEQQKSQQAGDAIGAAFVSGLTDQLARLAAGEELDPAMFVGEILAGVIQTAAGVLGMVFPGVGAIVGAVGNLAALGIRTGARALSGKGNKKMHSGGFVEPERYHNGLMMAPGEVPAILQEGEAVLSRSNVAAMGGRQGVERAKRGGMGAGFVVNVSALDAKSAAESFVSGVDRGLKQALRTGQGFLPQLLPHGVR